MLNLNLEPFGPSHLCDVIKSFESKTSCDLDGISTKLLKHIISVISHPLSHIFNLSTASGTFPSMHKTSHTVPIFKAGSPLLCDNYRPISLLSTLSKLLEKIVCRQLVAHLEDNNLIYAHQYGFQHNKSTQHNLIQLTNFINTALNEKNTQLASSWT
jgi:potassium voltage-gated channel Eag-related subfamily H protein 8